MAINITLLPAVPSRNDSPTTFATKANNFLAALPTFVNELNAYAPQVVAGNVNGDFNVTNGSVDIESSTSAWALDVTNNNSGAGGTIKTVNTLTLNPSFSYGVNRFELNRTIDATSSIVTRTLDVITNFNQNGFNHTATRSAGGPTPARLYLEASGASGTIDNLVSVFSDIRNIGGGTVSNMIAYTSNFGNSGGGSVTNTYSFYAPNEGNGTNNYAFYTDMIAGTGNWAFYSSSNAASYLGGALTVNGLVTLNSGLAVTGSITATGNLTTSLPGSNFGYATGAGGTVSQTTSRTTGITLSKPCGTVTLVSATTTAGQVSEFTFTNPRIKTNDVVLFSQKSGNGMYIVNTKTVSAGSCVVAVYTPIAVTTAEAPVFNFIVLTSVTS